MQPHVRWSKALSALSWFDRAVLGLFLACAAYLFVGFLSPDSLTLAGNPVAVWVLWVMRIAIPVAAAAVVVLYTRLRLGAIDAKTLVLFTIASCLSVYVGYTVADLMYQGWFEKHRSQFHPYLQLMPAPLHVRPSASGAPVRIFCLGGSTTELPDSRGRDWPSRVEEILRARYHMPDVQVYNCGRIWYTSLHSLINYETNLRPYRPAAILIMQSVNDLLHNADFSDFSRGPFRQDYGHFYGPVNRIIDRRTLARYAADLVRRLWYAKPRREVTTTRFPGLDAYVRNIRTIVALARLDSTRVILMTEPCLAKEHLSPEETEAIRMLRTEALNDSIMWSSETLTNGMAQYNGALKRIAQEEGLQLIDLDAAVPKSLTYFRDEVHYQDTTFALVADVVADAIGEWDHRRSTTKSKK